MVTVALLGKVQSSVLLTIDSFFLMPHYLDKIKSIYSNSKLVCEVTVTRYGVEVLKIHNKSVVHKNTKQIYYIT